MMKHTMITAIVVSLTTLSPAVAAEWVVGAGHSDFSGDRAEDAVALTLEVHGAPRWSLGSVGIGFAGGAMIDDIGDAWVGVGLSGLAALGDRWFVEASVMPGFYEEGQARNDLGDAVEFRSLIGLGYTLDRGTRVSVGFDHRSNAGLGDDNPGVNTFSLRVRRGF